MSNILIGTMVIFYTIQSFLCKKFTDNYPGEGKYASYVFTIINNSLVALITLLFSGLKFNPSVLTVVLGMSNAIALYFYNYFIVSCSQTGPYSILMVFSIAGGIIVPCVGSMFLYNELINLRQLFSIIIIFVAVYLISQKAENKQSEKKISGKFIFLCSMLGLFNGIYGLLLNIQQNTTGANEKEEMIIITFFTAAIISLFTLIPKAKSTLGSVMKQSGASAVYLFCCGVVSALAINLMVYIIPYVNITVLYTIDNSGVMLLSVLCSVIFFKEKLSLKNIIGCIIMCIGLVGVAI